MDDDVIEIAQMLEEKCEGRVPIVVLKVLRNDPELLEDFLSDPELLEMFIPASRIEYVVPIPQDIRESLGMTQKEFYQSFNIPLKVLKRWECGFRKPTRMEESYLFAISQFPKPCRIAQLTSDIPDIRRIRRSQGLTREDFACDFGIYIESLIDCERRKRIPTPAEVAYLKVIDLFPEQCEKAQKASKIETFFD